MAALKGKIQSAERHFQDAVITAARFGFVHDAALASERYGEFLLNDRPQPCELDKQEALYRFGEAIKYYSDWGAVSKVASLQNKYADLWKPPGEVSSFIQSGEQGAKLPLSIKKNADL
jgi:hypothetical protein